VNLKVIGRDRGKDIRKKTMGAKKLFRGGGGVEDELNEGAGVRVICDYEDAAEVRRGIGQKYIVAREESRKGIRITWKTRKCCRLT